MSIQINLEEYKTLKKAKLIAADLESILKLLTAHKKSLVQYHKYIPVKEVYQLIVQNQGLLQLHLNKYHKVIQNHGSKDEKSS